MRPILPDGSHSVIEKGGKQLPKYASFDHTQPAPQLVTGWYDTDAFEYPTLPATDDLFGVTDTQWGNRPLNPCVIDNGAIVELPPPPPTPAQQAQQELAARKANGIAITCTDDSSIDATYALDDLTLAQVGSVARDVSSGLGFPLGAPTFNYPDITSVPHTFNETQFVDLYKSMRDLVNDLTTQASVMAQGGTPVWPDQSATIPWVSRMPSQSATIP